MFQTVGPDGTPITAADARAARRHGAARRGHAAQGRLGVPRSAPTATDELCGFEKLPYQNFMANYIPSLAAPAPPMSFLRKVLKEGLVQEERLGVNPFKFGLVGSTDTHIAAAGAVREDQFPGHGGAGRPPSSTAAGLPDDIELNPGGLAVLWAEENSRDALFAAMRRREAYGTSGPRLVVRFFGGWDYPARSVRAADVRRAAATPHGVPMGGDLPPRPADAAAPTFAVWALRDPGGGEPAAPLQRIQIIKGWLESGAGARARLRRRRRRRQRRRRRPGFVRADRPGFDMLCTVWRDPDFDPAQRGVLLCPRAGEPDLPLEHLRVQRRRRRLPRRGAVPRALRRAAIRAIRKVVQERAWTSPVWYAPAAPPRRGSPGETRAAPLLRDRGSAVRPRLVDRPDLAATGTLGTAIPQ